MSNSDSNEQSCAEHPAIALALELMRRPSITPADEGCQQILAERLRAAGFRCESLQFDDVSNLWARKGNQSPLLCFAGHTDVVPPGPADAWLSDPFAPEIRGGYLYGRGAADMKTGLAAMTIAAERFLQSNSDHLGSLAFLITSDEEGLAKNGTRKVLDVLQERGEKIDWCVIGEPSSSERTGDVVRVGRRGSLNGELKLFGTQGHVAYPELADNPIHKMTELLTQLQNNVWDKGNDYFPATSFQIVRIDSSSGAANVIPAQAECEFNFRYSSEWTAPGLRAAVEAIVDTQSADYAIDWQLSGEPFLTTDGDLIAATVAAIKSHSGCGPELSTGGGTSDGRFIAPTGAEVVELGVVNATAHKANECTKASHVAEVCDLYLKIMNTLLIN